MDLTIVDELQKLVEPNPQVHAMWIAGSVAEGYAGEYSDVDLWLDIDDGRDEVIFETIEKFLSTKGRLDVNFGEGITAPFSHKVYHLSHMDPFHFIEVTLHSHSHAFGMFDRLRKIKVIFDKDDVTNFEPVDQASYSKMLQERKQFLLDKITLGKISVDKEIRRGQFPDAMHNYLFWLAQQPIGQLQESAWYFVFSCWSGGFERI